MTRYHLVGCSRCDALWILADKADQQTATCPRCRTRHPTDRLRSLTTAAEKATVEAARTARLAERAGVDPGELPAIDPDAVFEPVIDDATQLAAAGIDVPDAPPTPVTRDRRRTLLGLIDELDEPTREAVLSAAAAAGIEATAAAAMLERLHREGAVTRREGRYRVL
jgi:hypothetical protein